MLCGNLSNEADREMMLTLEVIMKILEISWMAERKGSGCEGNGKGNAEKDGAGRNESGGRFEG